MKGAVRPFAALRLFCNARFLARFARFAALYNARFLARSLRSDLSLSRSGLLQVSLPALRFLAVTPTSSCLPRAS